MPKRIAPLSDIQIKNANPIEFTDEEARAWIEQDYQASLKLK